MHIDVLWAALKVIDYVLLILVVKAHSLFEKERAYLSLESISGVAHPVIWFEQIVSRLQVHDLMSVLDSHMKIFIESDTNIELIVDDKLPVDSL